jgi:predicted DCC family thiol-disulfide oxidoreductase YuxK
LIVVAVLTRYRGGVTSMPGGRAVRPILIFDGDCAFCTTSAQWLQRRLHSTVAVEPWQYVDLALYGTDAQHAQHEVIWVDCAGRLYGGAQAFAQWLIHTGGAWRPIGLLITLPPVRWIAAGVYRLIANNRDRMPGGTPACAVRPARPHHPPSPPGDA